MRNTKLRGGRKRYIPQFHFAKFQHCILNKKCHIFWSFCYQNIFTFVIKFCIQKHVISFIGVLYQSWYILPLALIIDEFITGAHFSDWTGKRNIFGLTCPFFVYRHWCDGLDKEFFLNFPPLRRREIYEQKKRKTWRKIWRRPHVGSCAEVRQIRPSTTEDCTPIVPGQL